MFDNKDKRIRGARGVAIRAAFLAKHPLCVKCKEHGVVRVADEVDHIIPLAIGGMDVDGNKQGLCKPHHQLKTASEGGSSLGAKTYPDWLEPSLGHLTIVFGPPGSGKSTYVRDRAKSADVVIDLDEIRAEISGLPLYEGGSEWLGPAIRRRNSLLGGLKKIARPAWFITTGSGKQDRMWWTDKLKPTNVVVMKPSIDECIARIRSDSRRSDEVRLRHIKAAREWFLAEGRGWRMVSPMGFDENGSPLNEMHHGRA